MRRFLNVMTSVLVFSAIMDFGLWVTRGYLIPSWAIAVMSLGCAVLIQVVKRLIV